MDMLAWSAVELAAKIKQKEVTVKEAVDAVFSRIEEKEKDLNCYVTLEKEKALKKAEEVQKKIDDGTLTGALAGVPVAVKDNMCTEGILTTCSSKILSNFIPTYNAEAVSALERAGAVMIGKTNMDEFAMGSTTETSAYGETKNPWNENHVPGGRMLLCPWIRYGRLDPPARFFLRSSGDEAHLRHGIPLRADRLRFFFRPDRAAYKKCGGLRRRYGDHSVP